MNTLLLVILVSLVMLQRRCIGLLLSWIPLRLLNKKAKKYVTNKHPQKREDKNTPVEKIKTRTFKFVLLHYLSGFNRYWDFECGRIPSHRIRNFMYRTIWLVELAPKAVIYWGAEIRAGYNLTIGEGSIIGDNALLDARNKIIIGKNVNFSSRVSIYTEHHDHRDPYFRGNSDGSFRVQIDDRAWIGPNVTILHSVHIGEGAVVAAGSVVTKNIPPFAIVAGIPARVIGERNHDLRYEFDGTYLPFY